jgi:DNA-binding MarR family transcriptional regulator
MPITRISKKMLVSSANMTGIAKRLEKNGFLLRKGDLNDERIKLLEITPKGIQTLKNIKTYDELRTINFLKDCPDKDKKILISYIRKILELDRI